ncbi:MAG: hypothetical protein Q7N87_03680 [Candidatus Uhrbacteria bacterium]|nr:hypothetical protein [Candidatus Uhrbacteria bacterium]
MSPKGHRRAHVVPITAPSFPTLPRPRVYKTIAYTFVGVVVLVVIGVLWLSSARADITIHAKQEIVVLDHVVEVAKAPEQGQLSGRVVQGVFEKIQEFEVNALATSTAKNMDVEKIAVNQNVPNVVAKGSVRVINNYARSQTLVKTTRLLTADKKLYRIDKTIVIPAGEEVTVPAYADQPGTAFVIGPAKFTIPGLWIDLQKLIYAVSDQPFIAVPTKDVPATVKVTSSEKSGKLVTAGHVAEAEKVLTDAVLEQAKKALAVEVSEAKFGEVSYVVKVLDKKTNVSAGQHADTFLASVKLDVTAVYYPKEDMRALIRSKIKEKIPEGRELLPLDPTSLVFSIETTDAKSETAAIHVKGDGTYRLTAASPTLAKSLVAGKSKSEATALLRAVPGVNDVNIKVRPGWWGKVPRLKDHVEIKVE